MTDPMPQAVNKPAAILAVQCVTILTSVVYALDALGAIGLVGEVGFMTAIRTAGLAAAISWFSLAVWSGVGRRRTATRRLVLNYLWVMVLIYPVMNVMRSFGLLAPAPRFSDTQLLGAAAFELSRYAVYLGLILWFGLSKNLRNYLAPRAAATAESGAESGAESAVPKNGEAPEG